MSALRGHGPGQRHRPVRALRRQQVAQRGRVDRPGLQHGRLVPAASSRARASTWTSRSRGTRRRSCTICSTRNRRRSRSRASTSTYEGLIPKLQKSVLSKDVDVAAAARPRLRRACGHVRHLSECDGTRLSQAARSSTIAGVSIADACAMQISDLAGWVRGLRRAVRGAAAGRTGRDPRLVRRDRAGLPEPRAAVGHAVGRRGAAHEDDPPPRVLADRRHLRLRRAHHGPAPPRRRAHERVAARAARQGQHRAGRRARTGGDRDRRPRRRPRPRRGAAAARLLRGHRRGPPRQRHADRAAPGRPRVPQARRAHAHGRPGDPRRHHPQPARDVDVDIPLGRVLVRGHRRWPDREEFPDPRFGVGPRRAWWRSTRARSAAPGAATRPPTRGCSTRSARRSPRPTG